MPISYELDRACSVQSLSVYLQDVLPLAGGQLPHCALLCRLPAHRCRPAPHRHSVSPTSHPKIPCCRFTHRSSTPLMLVWQGGRGPHDSPLRQVSAVETGLCRCLLDTKPRHFSPGEAAVLNNFSELVIRELEAAWVESTAAQQQLLRSAECYGQPYLVVDMAQEGGHILYMSSSAQILTGVSRSPAALQRTPSI